jgi:hypothetical protein
MAEVVLAAEKRLIGSTTIEHTVEVEAHRSHRVKRMLHISAAQSPDADLVRRDIAGAKRGSVEVVWKRNALSHARMIP